MKLVQKHRLESKKGQTSSGYLKFRGQGRSGVEETKPVMHSVFYQILQRPPWLGSSRA